MIIIRYHHPVTPIILVQWDSNFQPQISISFTRRRNLSHSLILIGSHTFKMWQGDVNS